MKKPARTPSPSPSIRIVGIGASAGGLEAFTSLLRHLPEKANVAYVLVQHLDPTHRSLLSEILAKTTSLPVTEIEQNTQVAANCIYVIPPNCDLAVEQGVLKLTPREKSGGAARGIDHFLKSLAADQKEHAIGIILSGAGSDGALGLKAIKGAGGITFAQDSSTAKYDSMPRSAIGTGCVDFVLPPEKIAAEISRLIDRPATTRSRAAANARDRHGKVSRTSNVFGAVEPTPDLPGFEWPTAPEDLNLRKIFLLLRSRTGTDFSLYRPNTIRRRITRRMAIAKVKSLEAYARHLRDNPPEIDTLYRDLLINVTSFFRNPGVFDMLKRKIFPALVKAHSSKDALRIWVAGCSTGQEPYSLAMAYTEFCEQNGTHVPLQIFATDLNHNVLEHARSGRYTRAQVESLSAGRRAQFFARDGEDYRVQKAIRDMVVFAQQNLLTDPPFTRVDLISCRNLLIYLEPALQQKIIPAFHYALKPHGYLLLGTSESVGQFANLFANAAKNQKVYVKKAAASFLRYERPPTLPAPRALPRGTASLAAAEFNPADAFKEADRVTLTKYAPASVLIHEDGEILQFRGDTHRYLELPTGKANFNLFKMARDGLVLPLQRAMQRARRDNRNVREREVRFDGRKGIVNLEIVPLKHLRQRCYLILFEKLPGKVRPLPAAPAGGKRGAANAVDARRLVELRQELGDTRDHLSTLQEQHDTSVEELQAANEEVQSANEELQSLNEELETSNEELESANEELTTLNEELTTRNTELRESEQQLREQAELLDLAPVLVRSPKDRIVLWNQGAEKLYGFTRDEALGQTSYLLLNAQFEQPLAKIQAEFQKRGRWEGEVLHRRKDGGLVTIATQWVLHRDPQGKVRAILEVNTDITARKHAERSLRESEELNRRILQSSPDCITVLDRGGRLTFMNARGLELMEIEEFKTVANLYWPHSWESPARTLAEQAFRTALEGEIGRFHGEARTPKGAVKWWDVVVRPMLGPDGKPEKILVVSRDITARKLAELAENELSRLAALRGDIAVALSRPGDTQPVLQHIAELLVRDTEAALAQIWTLADSAARPQRLAQAGATLALEEGHVSPRTGGFEISRILQGREPFVSNDVPHDTIDGASVWARREHITGFAGYPLVFEDQVLGAITLFFHGPVEPRLLRELALSADALAQFIHRKRNEEERARLFHDAMESRRAALAASRAKDEFLATLSHELRTPLSPVLLLASDGADNTNFPDEVRKIFALIGNNVSLEARLIDDLLDLTRLVHGKMSLEFKPLDVHTVLREALRIVAADIEQNRIDLALSLPAARSIMLGDADRLQQVFWNILKNAVKFTPAGGRISVETSLAGDETIRIRISDTGIGLSREDLERIFAAFTQAIPRRGGLGLGLSIARQITELHGGKIRAVSDGPKKGSTFEIDLPLARHVSLSTPILTVATRADGMAARPRALGADGAAVSPLEAVPARRILLIEDHESTRLVLKELLRRRRFDVTTAGTLAEARARAQTAEYDLVISDLGLPDGDGCDLWSELHAKNPRAIGIALSGFGMEEDLARSRAAGFAHHLTKPINTRALDEVLAHTFPAADAR